MKRAPLNIFQKTQRLWEQMHPYNAAQVMQLDGPGDAEQVGAAFNEAMRDLGLGAFIVEGNHYHIDATVALPALDRPASDWTAHVSRQLNIRFEGDSGVPFRPFFIRNGDSHMAGVVYHHWVADSVSIRILMRQWMLRLVAPYRAARVPVQLPQGTMRRYFSSSSTGWSRIGEFARLVQFTNQMRRARRLTHDDQCLDVAVKMRRLEDGLVEQLKKRARADRATVGDIFVAAGAEACALYGPALATPRRPDLAFGSIVDLRARHPGISPNIFGLFLGFTISRFDQRALDDFHQLIQSTRRQSHGHRRRRSAESSQFRMWMGLQFGMRQKRGKLQEFYRKRFALSGGLSSVNLNVDWQQQYHPSPLQQYYRISPVGPLMPIVFTPTTLGQSLHTCFTYRVATVAEDRANQILDAFCQRLERYARGLP